MHDGNDNKLKIIKELMEQLQEEMAYGADDFEERLGRKKPDVEVVKIKSESPDMEKMEEMVGKDLDGDHEEGESLKHKRMVMGGNDEDIPHEEDMDDAAYMDSRDAESPEDELKKRLMKLRA